MCFSPVASVCGLKQHFLVNRIQQTNQPPSQVQQVTWSCGDCWYRGALPSLSQHCKSPLRFPIIIEDTQRHWCQERARSLHPGEWDQPFLLQVPRSHVWLTCCKHGICFTIQVFCISLWTPEAGRSQWSDDRRHLRHRNRAGSWWCAWWQFSYYTFNLLSWQVLQPSFKEETSHGSQEMMQVIIHFNCTSVSHKVELTSYNRHCLLKLTLLTALDPGAPYGVFWCTSIPSLRLDKPSWLRRSMPSKNPSWRNWWYFGLPWTTNTWPLTLGKTAHSGWDLVCTPIGPPCSQLAALNKSAHREDDVQPSSLSGGSCAIHCDFYDNSNHGLWMWNETWTNNGQL